MKITTSLNPAKKNENTNYFPHRGSKLFGRQTSNSRPKSIRFRAPPRKKTKISAPSAVDPRGFCKLAAYHCQVLIFTTHTKVTNNQKYTISKELFYSDPLPNLKGACQQLIVGHHVLTLLYNRLEGVDGVKLMLKQVCCSFITSANYVAGIHFSRDVIYMYENGKRFSGRSIWMMATHFSPQLRRSYLWCQSCHLKLSIYTLASKWLGTGVGEMKCNFFC